MKKCLLLILFENWASLFCDWMNISHPTHLPTKKTAHKGEPVWGSKFDKWELEECSLKRGKVAVIKMAAFPQLLFFGAKMAALAAVAGRARSWLLEGGEFREGPGASSCPLFPSQSTGKGKFLTGSLNVNHGGDTPSFLCLFALFLVLATA